MATHSSTLAWKISRRSLVGYSPWDREESDTTERLHFHFSLSCIGEGHGNPLYRGPAPVGSRDSLGRTVLATEINRERDKERILQLRKQKRGKSLIFLGLCRKPIKPQHRICSVHIGCRHLLK